MPRICPLFSSSEGNSTYISGSEGAVLIDTGVSAKAIFASLDHHGLDASDIRAILITHSHSDHVRSLKTMSSKLGVPIYATEPTLAALISDGKIAGSSNPVAVSNPFTAAGMLITPFETSHDCPGSAGYIFELPGGIKIAVCTDLGVVTDDIRKSLNGCDAVLFESNHDISMLKNGPYPPELKMRILSDKGHLSNVACATELPAFLQSGTTRFILGHLSRHNNLPQIAKSCAESILIENGAKNGRDYMLYVAPPKDGEIIYL